MHGQSAGKALSELVDKRQKCLEMTDDEIKSSLPHSRILGYMTELEGSQKECHSNSPCEVFFTIISKQSVSYFTNNLIEVDSKASKISGGFTLDCSVLKIYITKSDKIYEQSWRDTTFTGNT